MRAERQTPTIKVGTSLFQLYTPAGETGLRGGQFTVIEVHQDGVLLSIPDGSSLKVSFSEAENLFA